MEKAAKSMNKGEIAVMYVAIQTRDPRSLMTINSVTRHVETATDVLFEAVEASIFITSTCVRTSESLRIPLSYLDNHQRNYVKHIWFDDWLLKLARKLSDIDTLLHASYCNNEVISLLHRSDRGVDLNERVFKCFRRQLRREGRQ